MGRDLGAAERRPQLVPPGRGDDDLAPARQADALAVPLDADRPRDGDEQLLAPPDRLRLEHDLGRRDRLVQRVDAPEQGAELEAAEDLLQRRAVGRRRDELRRVDVERQVAAHRREQLGFARLLGVLAHRLAPRRRELVGVLDHGLERAVLRDQLPGGLVTDPGDPRDVVRRVALQSDEVGHLVGAHAVPQLDAVGRVDVHVGDPARGHHQADVLAAELERVTVGGDDARADPRLVGTRRDRRDHVVCLPALELEVPVAERLDDGPEVRELLPEQVRHRPPALLVGLRDLGAVRRPGVPRDADPPRLVVGEELEEHVREPEERVRRLAPRRLQLLREREVRAVGEVVAVDEEELRVLRRAVVELKLLAGQRLRAHRSSLTDEDPPPGRRETVPTDDARPSPAL